MLSVLQELLQQSIQSLEWAMMLLIVGGGGYLVVHSRGVPLLKIREGIRLLFRKEQAAGISRFQALSAVIAATVGLGNISGVAIAIHMGGPGVLVWMWVTALIGSMTKFCSCS